MRFIARFIQALDLTRSLWLWDAPYCDGSALMTAQAKWDERFGIRIIDASEFPDA